MPCRKPKPALVRISWSFIGLMSHRTYHQILAERNQFPRWTPGMTSAVETTTWPLSLMRIYHVSMQGRFLPGRGAGGGAERSAAMIQSREAAGSITSSISK